MAVPESLAINLNSYTFDDLPLREDETVLASVRMFIDSGLMESLRMDRQVKERGLLSHHNVYVPTVSVVPSHH